MVVPEFVHSSLIIYTVWEFCVYLCLLQGWDLFVTDLSVQYVPANIDTGKPDTVINPG